MRQGQFSAALPLLEWQLAGDSDGSVHVQLARVLAELGQQEKADAMLAKSQELQRHVTGESGRSGQAGDHAAEIATGVNSKKRLTSESIGCWKLTILFPDLDRR